VARLVARGAAACDVPRALGRRVLGHVRDSEGVLGAAAVGCACGVQVVMLRGWQGLRGKAFGAAGLQGWLVRDARVERSSWALSSSCDEFWHS